MLKYVKVSCRYNIHLWDLSVGRSQKQLQNTLFPPAVQNILRSTPTYIMAIIFHDMLHLYYRNWLISAVAVQDKHKAINRAVFFPVSGCLDSVCPEFGVTGPLPVNTDTLQDAVRPARWLQQTLSPAQCQQAYYLYRFYNRENNIWWLCT